MVPNKLIYYKIVEQFSDLLLDSVSYHKYVVLYYYEKADYFLLSESLTNYVHIWITHVQTVLYGHKKEGLRYFRELICYSNFSILEYLYSYVYICLTY